MKTKVMFPNRIDGKLDLLCPFTGWRFNNMDEFKEHIKKYFSKETGYPGMYFKVKEGLRIVFTGHQYISDSRGKWSLFDPDTEERPTRWQHLDETLLEYFDDAEYIDKMWDAIGKIINTQGGIAVHIQ